MAKIYYRRYKKRIDQNEITVDQAVELAKTEVPAKWRDEVIELLYMNTEETITVG